jgi:hypothetical protein
MTQRPWHEDDEVLLAELGRALRGAPPVPPTMIEQADAMYAWRTIDAELAALEFDSAVDEEPAVVRSESAQVHTLTFTCDSLVVELAVTDDVLLGQLVPPDASRVEVRRSGGASTTVDADSLGCFSVAPVPSGSFSLKISTARGVVVVTDWVTL